MFGLNSHTEKCMRRYISAFAAAVALGSIFAPAIASAKTSHIATNQLEVHAQPEVGSRNIRISGRGPANSPVVIHTVGYISQDLPQIPLGDNNGYTQLMTDGSGNFATEVSIATDNWEGSLVQIDASVPNSASHAKTQFKIGTVNVDKGFPSDHIPDH
jgi:hypothetical protein